MDDDICLIFAGTDKLRGPLFPTVVVTLREQFSRSPVQLLSWSCRFTLGLLCTAIAYPDLSWGDGLDTVEAGGYVADFSPHLRFH